MENRTRIARLFVEASPLGGILVAGLGGGIGAAVRRGFIEPVAIGAICESTPPWWCGLRLALLEGSSTHVLGLASLALAAASALLPLRFHRIVAHLASFIGGAGLLLYDASVSATALVVASLVLVVRRDSPASEPVADESSSPGSG